MKRIGIHYRTGDMFSNFANKADARSIDLPYVQEFVWNVHSYLKDFNISIYVFCELHSFEQYIQLSEHLSFATVLYRADEEFKQIAIAAECDVLLLSWSSFSWIFSLINHKSLKILYDQRFALEKYDNMKNIVKFNDTQLYEKIRLFLLNSQ